MSRLVVPGAIAIAVLGVACASREAPRAMAPTASPEAPAATMATPPPAGPTAADAFEAEVRPILARRCTPCHVPGGKMYERMPFDDAETVRGHREGILRRLDGDDKATVERWFAGS